MQFLPKQLVQEYVSNTFFPHLPLKMCKMQSIH